MTTAIPDYRGWQYHFSICYVGDSIRETLDITTDIIQLIPQIKPSLAYLTLQWLYSMQIRGFHIRKDSNEVCHSITVD